MPPANGFKRSKRGADELFKVRSFSCAVDSELQTHPTVYGATAHAALSMCSPKKGRRRPSDLHQLGATNYFSFTTDCHFKPAAGATEFSATHLIS